MDRYYRFIKKIADNKLQEFNKIGYALEGNNGPYFSLDSPVRNTAHWIIIFSYLWRKTNDRKYYEIVNKFADYIMDDSNYGVNGAIICRLDKGMDKTNGIIGQAWVMEGLIEAFKVTRNTEYIEVAEKIFKSQPYNYNTHVWDVVDIDGKEWGPDRTYNHQVWFAAAGSLLLDVVYNEEIENQIKDFLDYSDKLFYIHRNGLLYHQANCRTGITNKIKFFTRKILCELSHLFNIKSQSFNILMLEEGYHLFDLFGFALLIDRFGDNKVFKTKKFMKAVKYAASENHIKKLMHPSVVDKKSDVRCNKFEFNEYAFGYNSPAFEYPFVAIKLKGNINETLLERLWNEQISKTFDEKSQTFSKGNHDVNTLTARMYELVRYLEVQL